MVEGAAETPELEKALQDLLGPNRDRREAAHEALVTIASDPARRGALAERIRPLLGSAEPDVRGTSYVILALATGETAVSTLQTHLNEPDAGARSDLAHALSLCDEAGRPLLAGMLRDPVFEVRFEAACSLASASDERGLEVLLQALEIPPARFQALSALQKLSNRRALEPVQKLFRKFFISGFDRTGAAGVLAKLGNEEARDWLVRRVAKRRGDDRGLAIELVGELRLMGATEALVETLRDRGDLFRGAAARALGMLGDDRLRDMLVAILMSEEEDPETRMDAAEGLMHMGTHRARLALQEAAGEVQNAELREVVAEALRQLEAQGERE